MPRRLLFASTAFGVSLLPACMTPLPKSSAHRPSVQPTAAAKNPSAPVVVSKMARKSENFADTRSETNTALAQPGLPIGDSSPVPTGPALPELRPAEHKVAELTAPPVELEPSKAIAEAKVVQAPVEKPPEKIAEKPATVREPVPDAEGIIRAHDPVIRTGALPLVEPQPAPRIDSPSPIPLLTEPPLPTESLQAKPKMEEPPAVLAPTPVIKPPALPSGVIGSSLHQSNASPMLPIEAPTLPPAVEVKPPTPSSTGVESPLVKAVRAYQQNRPEEANEHLKACDPSSQQMLLSLMPVLVRLSEGKVAQMKAEEMDILLEQLVQAPNQLKAKASLKANNMRLCREVHNFAHVEPFPERHVFRPGDIVYLYLELTNFSCVGELKSGYTIALASNLELRDTANKVVWKADPKDEPDRVTTPPQDYYRNFRLCVPHVPAGSYTLFVKSTDQPTGRTLEKGVELQIGSK